MSVGDDDAAVSLLHRHAFRCRLFVVVKKNTIFTRFEARSSGEWADDYLYRVMILVFNLYSTVIRHGSDKLKKFQKDNIENLNINRTLSKLLTHEYANGC